MVLSVGGDTARLELPGGRAASFPLPPRAEITSLASLGGREWIAAGSSEDETGHRRLFLLTGDGRASRQLPPPPGQQGTVRRGAVLLVENGALAGLAWLEGDTDSSLAVRAAVWDVDGQAWQAPETVSRPGPGSQLALAGAVLGDGSWLLAWSAGDGEDDEIVWSRRTGPGAGGWSAVRPVSLDNQVPDATPVLVSAGSGALIAWIRYDGEGYRVQVARFDGRRWRDERPAGPVHSMYPSFVVAPDHLYLVYLSARPRSWSVLELDRAGRDLRRASVPSALAERPIVAEDAARDGLRLRWPSAQWEATAAWEKTAWEKKVP
jgi:hypothetical protein